MNAVKLEGKQDVVIENIVEIADEDYELGSYFVTCKMLSGRSIPAVEDKGPNFLLLACSQRQEPRENIIFDRVKS